MGCKTFKRIIASALSVAMLFSYEVSAATTYELYDLYDKECDVELPSTVVETIKGYEYAKKYVEMYHHVVSSEFDTTLLQNRLTGINQRLEEIKLELRAGYFLSMSEIYELEDEYQTLIDRRDNLNKSMETYTVDVDSVNTATVPSYSVYKEALKERNDFNAKLEIGIVDAINVPLQSQSILVNSSPMETTYKTIEGTGVLCLFNGIVEKVEDTKRGLTVVIDHYNGIKTYYKYLEETSLSEGDTVYQNQNIGYLLGTNLTLQLSLDGEFVDVTKLIKED